MAEKMTHIVAIDILNLRMEPGLSAEIRVRLLRNCLVRFLPKAVEYANGLNWQAIEAESGSRGWVDSQYLEQTKPVELGDHNPWYAK